MFCLIRTLNSTWCNVFLDRGSVDVAVVGADSRHVVMGRITHGLQSGVDVNILLYICCHCGQYLFASICSIICDMKIIKGYPYLLPNQYFQRRELLITFHEN